MMRTHRLGVVSILLLSALTETGAAQTFSVLHSFSGAADGAYPLDGGGTSFASGASFVSDSKGILYGTTSGIDTPGHYGTIFSLTPPAAGKTTYTYKLIYDFKVGSGDAFPSGTLYIDLSGNLYGVTSEGGTGNCTNSYGAVVGCGTVFELSPSRSGETHWTLTYLHRFAGGADGAIPDGGLAVDQSGTLYGVTEFGGSTTSECSTESYQPAGCGTIFSLTPPPSGSKKWAKKLLHLFDGANHGLIPLGPLTVGADNVLYGTTLVGGAAGVGTVFELSPPTTGATVWTEAVIHSFKGGLDGSIPGPPPVFDSTGDLLGTTFTGGSKTLGEGNGLGTIYRLAPPSGGEVEWIETVQHVFTGSDGANPTAGLRPYRNGSFITSTLDGGMGSCVFLAPFSSSGCGVIVQISPPATAGGKWLESTLFELGGAASGAFVWSGVFANAAGAILGATNQGGDVACGTTNFVPGCGTVFELVPAP